MELSRAYSKKASNYARYRWGYTPEAVETIFAVSGLAADCTVADIGSGTGILTRQLVKRAKHIYAVEPDPAMRAMAEIELGNQPSFRPIPGTASATTLLSHSIDLVTVAQALHWFDPQPARREFLRILKPGGWLAVLWNYPTDPELEEASVELHTEANGWNTAIDALRPEQPPLSLYYGHERYIEKDFPFSNELDWEAFLGSFVTDARAPDEDDPRFPNAVSCQRRIFERFSSHGRIRTAGCTHLVLGQVK